MYKLLPEEHKRKVEKEYFWRRLIVILQALIVVTLIGMAGLFPSYILSNMRQKEIGERLKAMGETVLSEDDKEVISWLEEMNLKLKVLSPKLDKEKISPLIENALSAKVGGIRINSLDWTKENSKILLVISGVATDRQALIAFERSLDSLQIGEVTFPVSNLAKDRNISFIVRVTLSEQ